MRGSMVIPRVWPPLCALTPAGRLVGAADLLPVHDQFRQCEDGAFVLLRGHRHGLDAILDRAEGRLPSDLRLESTPVFGKITLHP